MSRMDRVNQQIKKEVSLVIQQELADPRLKFVTITEAKVSKDLRHAKVFFSVLGKAKQVEDAEQGLESARGIIRKYVGQRMEMRHTPELFFVYDKTLEYSARIDETLREINDEIK